MGCFHRAPPLEARGSMCKRRQKGCKSQSGGDDSGHSRADAPRKSQSLEWHGQDLRRFKLHRVPTLGRESGHSIPPLTKKISAIDTLL